MPKLSLLTKQAIQAAKDQDWQNAVSLNQDILSINEEDILALNRLGLALLQLKKIAEAKKVFNQVLSKDKSNIIATKHLAKLKNNQAINNLSFSNNYFIEEPGKTKIIELHRLADKKTISKLSIGQQCQLLLKNRFISIETASGEYIGALPEDISFRLTKLINTGNEYSCFIHSYQENRCCVHIRETSSSSKNSNIQSFPSNKSSINSIQSDVPFLIDDDVPVQIIDSDSDTEKFNQALEDLGD